MRLGTARLRQQVMNRTALFTCCSCTNNSICPPGPSCILCCTVLYCTAPCCAVLCSHFHKLPPGLQKGVALELGVAVEMLLGLIINLVVLHATGAWGCCCLDMLGAGTASWWCKCTTMQHPGALPFTIDHKAAVDAHFSRFPLQPTGPRHASPVAHVYDVSLLSVTCLHT